VGWLKFRMWILDWTGYENAFKIKKKKLADIMNSLFPIHVSPWMRIRLYLQ
jgi:hypothetical protein